MRKIKIIVIEDNDLMIEMIKSCLENEPEFEIIGMAQNGENGLNLIQSLLPDVVLLDLILPGMDGFEILSKASRYYPSVKFLVLSSLSDDYFVKKALQFGAAYYLVKPFNGSILKERIMDLLSVDQKKIEIKQPIQKPITINKEEEKVEDYKAKLSDKISNILLSIGIPANLVGYKILKEAILVAIEQPDLIYSITKGLYPEVAARLNTTVSGVERAIRHVIDTSWSRGKMENINAILGMHVYSNNEKPTNSEFIALLSDKLVAECL